MGDPGEGIAMMTLKVQFGRDTHQLRVPTDSKVDVVTAELQSLTGVFQRSQKLIYKGISPPMNFSGVRALLCLLEDLWVIGDAAQLNIIF